MGWYVMICDNMWWYVGKFYLHDRVAQGGDVSILRHQDILDTARVGGVHQGLHQQQAHQSVQAGLQLAGLKIIDMFCQRTAYTIGGRLEMP